MQGNGSKYKSVVNHIMEGIGEGRYGLNDRLPSVNEFRAMYSLARSTVFTALNELRSRGIVDSSPGVGYFIASVEVASPKRILLLFNEMNLFKEDLYNSFMEAVDPSASVDLMFHNYDRRLLDTLLDEANGKYDAYVVMPGKFEGTLPLLESLRGEVLLLDHIHPELEGKFPAVVQNFEQDILRALTPQLDRLKKYNRIVMVQRGEKEPRERYSGLRRFCRANGMGHALIGTARGREITEGEIYMVVDDRDLVWLIKRAERQGFVPGRQFGIIACNDTLLREVMGVTTISTDFRQMGRTLASMVGRNRTRTVENPCRLALRGSI